MIKLKRIYLAAEKSDGFRVLVERLWPRGVSKEKAAVDLWLKDIAPSTELRQWFGHEAEKWDEFQARYRTELEHNSAVAELRALMREHAHITCVYAASDERNSATLLQHFMENT